ncbi:uncharacterized protein LOC113635103, partial [Tachysurus ichikawai]
MAARGVRNLTTLTRRHGVKVASAASVEDVCLAIGEVVGYECIMAASRMNYATVVFLSTKKVTLTNIPPFISDKLILLEALSCHGKPVSSVREIPITIKSPFLKEVTSFRRFVCMIVKDNAELDIEFNFRIDGFDYVVFATTSKMRCLCCGKEGHLVRTCPDRFNKDNGTKSQNTTTEPAVHQTPESNRAEADPVPRRERTSTDESTPLLVVGLQYFSQGTLLQLLLK